LLLTASSARQSVSLGHVFDFVFTHQQVLDDLLGDGGAALGWISSFCRRGIICHIPSSLLLPCNRASFRRLLPFRVPAPLRVAIRAGDGSQYQRTVTASGENARQMARRVWMHTKPKDDIEQDDPG
jgi:hypothetical protein